MFSKYRGCFELQIIFIHIPKTAGVSIATSLEKQEALFLRKGYQTHGFVKKIIIEEDFHLPIMAVVRNPYDRLYSIFEFYQYRPRIDQTPNQLKYEKLGRTDIDLDMTFEQFVLSYESRFAGKRIQFNPCYDFVEKDNRIIATDILKFENLSEDYDNFCKKYNIKNDLAHVNVNSKKTELKDKSTLYNKNMIDVVERAFINDLRHFDYNYQMFLNSR